MWAMIGTSIALVIWTSGLLYMATNAEKKRVTKAQVGDGKEENFKADTTGDINV
jgi:ACS family pantothenate transporter-like MFS transporter